MKIYLDEHLQIICHTCARGWYRKERDLFLNWGHFQEHHWHGEGPDAIIELLNSLAEDQAPDNLYVLMLEGKEDVICLSCRRLIMSKKQLQEEEE